jgi:hypothetical protein
LVAVTYQVYLSPVTRGALPVTAVDVNANGEEALGMLKYQPAWVLSVVA